MDPKTAYDRIDDVQLLDVREPDEWEAGHIDGATHIPMGELNARQGEIANGQKVVTVCRSGARSGQVAAALAKAGYDVENLDGGMQAWAAADLPFVSDNGGDPRVA